MAPDAGADLSRFVEAQQLTYAAALAELRAGRKRTHWMWFIFPQIAGLGMSATSIFYAIQSAEEARAYLDHDLLGPRLRECTLAVLSNRDRTAEQIFGAVDAMKLRSSMTLFEHVGGSDEPFAACLAAFFAGRRDERTLERLRA